MQPHLPKIANLAILDLCKVTKKQVAHFAMNLLQMEH